MDGDRVLHFLNQTSILFVVVNTKVRRYKDLRNRDVTFIITTYLPENMIYQNLTSSLLSNYQFLFCLSLTTLSLGSKRQMMHTLEPVRYIGMTESKE